jgi:hypothetical protein
MGILSMEIYQLIGLEPVSLRKGRKRKLGKIMLII